MKVIAIIPARGGSKGIPRKNVIDFCGRPLLSWSIAQAIASRCIDEVWVTSDDDEILTVAEKAGAKLVRRPVDISGDTATSESAWIHAIQEISKSRRPDLVFGMQATSPLRDPLDLKKALELYRNEGYDSLFSSSHLEDHFIWKRKGDSMESITYDFKNRKRRQNIEPSFLENGSFFIFKPNDIIANNNRLYGRIGCYVMEGYKSFQIDSPSDLKLCSVIMKGYGLNELC